MSAKRGKNDRSRGIITFDTFRALAPRAPRVRVPVVSVGFLERRKVVTQRPGLSTEYFQRLRI